VQFVSSSVTGVDLLPWFPSSAKGIAQVFLGASIGTCLQREMFAGMGRTVVVGLVSALCLVLIMLGCSMGVSAMYGIPLITSILAFAPGGVAEMAIAAVVLKADASFVVAVQTLRLIFIFLILPPIFRLLHDRLARD
ncbi:MAG: AbrB family transcriptional regulator, partial [Tumebacillaceae bacterium]